MLLFTLAEASAAVGATRSRLKKVEALAAVLRQADAGEAPIVAAYLGGTLRQRRTGAGWRAVADLPAAASEPSLTVTEVDAALEELAGTAGAGSAKRRAAILHELFSRATAIEQRYLAGLIVGEVRQGALDGLLIEAVAAASGVPAATVRRAAMLAGSTTAVVTAALVGGAEALASFDLRVGTGVRPMLASSAPTVAEGVVRAGGDEVAVEAKLDGIRVQVHVDGGEVTVLTRSLDDITARVPEVVAVARSLPVRSVILDGEALALDESGRPRLFQDTASRGFPLTPWFFDALSLDGEQLIDRPLAERFAALAAVVPDRYRVERLVTGDASAAEEFSRRVIAQGHEGVVIKNLDAPYAAGRRGAEWVKVKPVHTLDLVVLAVEWGSGRRQGTLSNIHLGARTPDGFVMLGKTFKGMTDEMLAWQTRRFQELETRRDGYTVHVRPEQVVEIAFDGVQRSSRYPGGVALRFARVVRYRDDKSASQADTLETVLRLAVRE